MGTQGYFERGFGCQSGDQFAQIHFVFFDEVELAAASGGKSEGKGVDGIESVLRLNIRKNVCLLEMRNEQEREKRVRYKSGISARAKTKEFNKWNKEKAEVYKLIKCN